MLGQYRSATLVRLSGPAGVLEHITGAKGSPRTWEIPSSPHRCGTGNREKGNGIDEGKSEWFVVPKEVGEPAPRDPMEGRDHLGIRTEEGNMSRALDLGKVSTRLARIGKKAKEAPDLVFTSLAHNIDLFFLWEAFAKTRKDGAPGVDGVTWWDYKANWQENLKALKEKLMSGSYKAPPTKRVYIPKSKTSKRPIALPTLEDKVLQRAVAMILGAIYEEEFYDFSYGFRPGKSQHQAVKAVRNRLQKSRGGWILEVDIKGFFEAIDFKILRDFLDRRVRDGVLRRTIDKWLNAGVLEDGVIKRQKGGTPQGGVISPILANIYLHEVIDKWFVEDVKPRMENTAECYRFADDVIMIFDSRRDAERVYKVIGKRLAKYGLEAHPEKTRLTNFNKRFGRGKGKEDTFTFLGFTFYWAWNRWGVATVMRKTAREKLRKSLGKVRDWCHKYRHKPLSWQHQKLSEKLKGHYAYYGIKGNRESLDKFYHTTVETWRKWLGRRSQRWTGSWKRFGEIFKKFPLPRPEIIHENV